MLRHIGYEKSAGTRPQGRERGGRGGCGPSLGILKLARERVLSVGGSLCYCTRNAGVPVLN